VKVVFGIKTYPCILTRTFVVTGSGSERPAIFSRAGNMNRWLVTVADTGFPGKANISLSLPSYLHVANVVGFLNQMGRLFNWLEVTSACLD